MPRLRLEKDIKPLSEFRANVASCLQQVHETRRPLIITHRGKSTAVLMDVAEYDALVERLELLEDLQTAERQIEEGQGVAHEAALQAVLERLPK
ncbi:MAG: type II toxin-antitoxin system prevent-host-death family antitoxin [Desulfuromonadales bacterium]